MATNWVTVDDTNGYLLPASIKVADGNLPTRLSDAQIRSLVSGLIAGTGLISVTTVNGVRTVTTTATANAPDATLLSRANHTGTQSADTVVDGTANKVYTTAEKTKLAGLVTGATANSTDAALRDRTTHTGVQAQSTVTNLVTDLGSKLRIRGEFATGVAYSVNDLVHVGDNSFYALIAHTSALPAPTTTNTYWKQLGSTDSTGGGSVTLPAGLVVERRYANSAWPVRGTLDASIVVEWVGPTAPPIGGNYAVAGKDRWTVTP